MRYLTPSLRRPARAALGLALAALGLLPSASSATNDSAMSTPAYRNPALPVEERVADLLGRMTLEEKVGQIMMWDARSEDLSFIATRNGLDPPHPRRENQPGAGSRRAKPPGIPLLVARTHPRPLVLERCTIFPTQLALAASWDAGLIEKVGRVTAEEMAPTGVH
jgi:beta-glucosidase